MEISIHTCSKEDWCETTVPYGLKYYLSPQSVFFCRRAKWVNLPYFEWDNWPNMQGSYVGQSDLITPFNTWLIQRIKLRPKQSPYNRVQLWYHRKFYLGQYDLIKHPMLKVGHPDLIKAKLGSLAF